MHRTSDNSHIRIGIVDTQEASCAVIALALRAERYCVDVQPVWVSEGCRGGYDLIILNPVAETGRVDLRIIRKANPFAQILILLESFDDLTGPMIGQGEADGVISRTMPVSSLLKAVSYISHGECRIAAHTAD